MPKRVTSIRISPDLKEELEQRAREAGVPSAALYERFIAEGLRHDAHPLIVFRDGAGGRRAVIAGTRVTVAQVIDTVLATEEHSIAEAAEYLDLPQSYVSECARYYASYRDEIDDWRNRLAEISEREREAWQREQRVFT